MNPQAEALKARTKKFAVDVLAFIDTFTQRGGAATTTGQQLCDAATAVAANYRATCRARSDAEFAAKIGGVLEEADESLLWLELAHTRQLGPADERGRLLDEAHQLTAIFASSTI